MRYLTILLIPFILVGCGAGGFQYETLEEVCDYAETVCDLIDTVYVSVEGPIVEFPLYTLECVIAGDFNAIYFDTDKAEIRSDAVPVLTQVVNTMANCPEMYATIEGHCDERDREAYNHALGMQRAFAVERWLIDNGVDSWRLSTMSYGELTPFATGNGEDFWKLNRRVEIRIE